MQVPVAEVPAEGEPGDDLAVDPLVILETLDRLGDEQRKRATVQVHHAEAHHLADEPDRCRPVVEARELIVDPGAALREAVELPVRVAAEEPDRVGPVAGVVAHGQEERDARGPEVAGEGHDHERRDEEGRERRGADREERDPGVRPEEGERAVDDHHVPLDRHPHGDVAGDVGVEGQHQDDGDDGRRPQRREDEREGHADLQRGAQVGHGRREPRGAQVGRVGAVHAAPQPREAGEGAVAGHHADDGREVVVQLGDAGPEPEGERDGLGAGDPIGGEREADQDHPVVLAARRQKDRLVRTTSRGRTTIAGRGAGRARSRARHAISTRTAAARSAGVEDHVEGAAGVAPEEREAGEDGQLRRPGAQEVEEAAERREVAARERSASAAEAEDLEEQAPHDGLLEGEGMEPPGGDRGDAS